MPPQVARLALAFAALLLLLAAPIVVTQALPLRVALASLVLGAMLAVLAAFDADQFRLPDVLTWPLAALGLAATAWIGAAPVLHHATAALLAGLVLWLFGEIYARARGRSGLGLGDVNLFAALAAWIGADGLLSVLLLACLTGLAALVAMHLAGRKLDAATPVPFGIFLALGGWATWIYGPIV